MATQSGRAHASLIIVRDTAAQATSVPVGPFPRPEPAAGTVAAAPHFAHSAGRRPLAASEIRPRALKRDARRADARGVTFDFADLLMDVIARRASDLHLTAGAPPMVRARGRLTPLEGYPKLSTTDTREIVYSILTNDQRQKFENDWQL